MWTRQSFRKIKRMLPLFTVSSVGSSAINSSSLQVDSSRLWQGEDITLVCSTQAVYVNITTNCLSTSGFLINEDDALDFSLDTRLYISAPSTLAQVQVIVWE